VFNRRFYISVVLDLIIIALVIGCEAIQQDIPISATVTVPRLPIEQTLVRPVPFSTRIQSPTPPATAFNTSNPLQANGSRISSGRTLTPTAIPPVNVYESSIEFKAYPYEKSWTPHQDPYNKFTFQAFDRRAYEALGTPRLATRYLPAIVMENEFLRLTFLPDLGGRLFQVTLKPTNQNLFYNNSVLKPTNWGPSNQGGWLAVGGIEWALPVNEHGYEWGVPWATQIDQSSDGATVTLSDMNASGGIHARIQVTLPAKAAYFVVTPHIENTAIDATRLQFWINAQINLSATKNVSPNTEFILPSKTVFVHSTGNRFIPTQNIPPDNAIAPSEALPWPIVSGKDLSRYENWEDYLGVFVTNPLMSFVGAYDHDAELGLVRVFPVRQVPGVKLFAFGAKFCCRSEFSDDDSDYFELWGGLPKTFFANDDVILAPGEVREWREYWLPFSHTGGVSVASRDLILFAKTEGRKISLSVYSAVIRKGTLSLVQGGNEVMKWSIQLRPGIPFKTDTTIREGNVKVLFAESNGDIIAETSQ
jgi:hypothetical protein